MIIDEEAYLSHYGILRKSGRYPWGSGGNTPEQRSKDFQGMLEELRSQGLSDVDIAKGWGMTTTELRDVNTIAVNARRAADIGMAQSLKDKGYSNVAIGKRMEINESSVRSLLAPGAQEKVEALRATSDMLKKEVDEHGYVDVGVGVENHLQISKTKLGTALAILKDEGYVVENIQVPQPGTGNMTLVKVLARPGEDYRSIKANRGSIHTIGVRSEDHGQSYFGLLPPLSINSDRIGINYAENGGAKADGVMYVRPGVKDVSLGNSRYAQVRVKVDGTHYLKGMAMYKDDLPKGVDIVFNTNKSDTGNKLDALKKLKDDPDNPFGAVVDQIKIDLPGGGKKVTSAMNIVNEEGDWGEWKKTLSTQVLSKQSPKLAKALLDETYNRHKEDLETIKSLTNPAVRRKLLESYADGADSSAVVLKAAALPRQASHVILPINTIKDTEVYAPNYRNGERVALIRYPHGGTFEIPELTVNNNHPEAKKLLGRAPDAIGINHKVAERLSGADFDGDTVLVVPQGSSVGSLKTSAPLQGLKNFNPQRDYAPYHGMRTIDGGTYNANTKEVEFPPGKKSSPRGKGREMGLVSNLITDMTIKRASSDEIARAVRHSMVVIDAEKHKLDYRRSAEKNGIAALMKKYQDRSQGGSSTLISRATSKTNIDEVKRVARIDPATGKKIPVPTNRNWVNDKGQTIYKQQKIDKLANTDDAHTLVSKNGGTVIEKVYADHSNRMKALANEARREMVNTKNLPYSQSAARVYGAEVASLKAKLNVALQNAPRERQALLQADQVIARKREANPDMDPTELKKVKFQALAEQRLRMGAKKTPVEITPREWEAIQSGAITNNMLTQILNNAKLEKVKELAQPRVVPTLMTGQMARAKALLANGHTQAEVADQLGVSLSTLKNSLGGE